MEVGWCCPVTSIAAWHRRRWRLRGRVPESLRPHGYDSSLSVRRERLYRPKTNISNISYPCKLFIGRAQSKMIMTLLVDLAGSDLFGLSQPPGEFFITLANMQAEHGSAVGASRQEPCWRAPHLHLVLVCWLFRRSLQWQSRSTKTVGRKYTT